MKKRFSFPLLAALLSFVLVSCDIVDDPVCTDCLQAGSGKKVLIEDFTGHQCGNCPRAHEQLDMLEDSYGEDLIVISVHAGGFARMTPSQGYTADYTTEFGNELEAFYNADLEGLPIGMVNRRTWDDGEVLQKFGNWGTQVASIIRETPTLDIEIESVIEDGASEAEIEISMTYLSQTNANHRLVVLITEDSIISKQSDYDVIPAGAITEYEHKHMLRSAVTSGGIWGDEVKAGTKFAGEEIERDLVVGLNPDWDPAHCHVIAFVVDVNDDLTQREIVQVTEGKLTP